MRTIRAKTSNRCQFILPKSTFCARASLDRLAATRRIITPYVIESRLMAMTGPTALMVSSCVATVQAITQMNKAPVMPTTIDCIYAGDQVLTHPLHLAWMEKAKVRTPEGWRFRYPKETRRWVRRWLNVRCAGRARQNPKSFRQQDWVIDPCITDDRRWRS